MIYLDNSATTKIDRRVTEKMLPYLKEEYGNPTSKYYTLATNAEEAVEEARSNLAQLLNCENEELIFTSGATESNNFVLKGISDYYQDQGNHIITTSIEHKSILKCCEYLETKGFNVTYLPVDSEGKVRPADLENAITNRTILVSIIWGNNELGTLNNIKKLAEITKKHDTFFHTDATQILGKVEINLQEIPFDFLSCSAHKIHGPKGIGATYIKLDDLGLKPELTPLIHGGGQEEDLRSGTLNVHNIVGFGEAAGIASTEMDTYIPKIKKLEKRFKEQIKNKISEIKFNGNQDYKIPGVINLTVPNINNEFIIREMKDRVAISTGSACSANEPSHVLEAIGLNQSQIASTLRISIGKFNTEEEIDSFIKILVNTIENFKI